MVLISTLLFLVIGSFYLFRPVTVVLHYKYPAKTMSVPSYFEGKKISYVGSEYELRIYNSTRFKAFLTFFDEDISSFYFRIPGESDFD